MVSRKLRELQQVNTSDKLENDSNSCSENESNMKIAPYKKRRLNVLSTSKSEEIRIITRKVQSHQILFGRKFNPKIHDFTARNSGLQVGINYSSKIIDYFQLFVNEELIEYIVEKTNNYWQQKSNTNLIAGTELSELYCFIAISFLMTRNKKLSLAEYWSRDKLLRSDIFGEIMSRDRYLLLL